MRLVNKREIPDLDVDILSVQNELLRKEQNKKKVAILPAVVLFMAWGITGFVLNPLLILGVCYLGFSFFLPFVIKKDNIGEFLNNLNAKGTFSNVQVLKVIDSKKYTKELQSYYTEAYKQFCETPVAEEDIKYKKAVLSQEELNNVEILNLEESVSQLVHEIDLYYDAYRLPKSVITNKEWDALFDVIFELMREKEITNVYYQVMGKFVRGTLAKVLVSEKESLALSDFLDNLVQLNSLISSSTPVRLTNEELEKLKINILNNSKVQRVSVSLNKIVDFSEYQQRKLLKK